MTIRTGVLLFLLLAAAGCTTPPDNYVPSPRAVTLPSGLQLDPVTFADLPDWNRGRQSEALAAFRRSCHKLVSLPGDTPVGPSGIAGQVSDWLAACRSANIIGQDEDDNARLFFQHLFRPYRLSDSSHGDEGLLTGYYLPRVKGSREHQPGYDVPLYRRPPDLVIADDGRLGRLDGGGQFRPYYTRAEIDAGALSGKGLELVWLASPIDAFFVSVQGSAEVSLTDGSHMRLGVAANNGQPYTAIGRTLVARGALKSNEVSMQSIVAWMQAHPSQAQALMQSNPRYIFFQEVSGEGPVGAEGVVLTAGRSLAIDPNYLPYGAPVFLDSYDAKGTPWRRLMLAQDTGAAIKGPLRADVYWGDGEVAEQSAGTMKSPGRFYLLLPIGVIPTASAGS
jgi:membrane-bound lytic murein transglycosylase A